MVLRSTLVSNFIGFLVSSSRKPHTHIHTQLARTARIDPQPPTPELVARGPTVSRLVQALGGNWDKRRESEEWDKALQYLGKTAAIIQAPAHTHSRTHTYVQSPSAEFSHAFW